MTELHSDRGLNAKDFARLRSFVQAKVGIQLPAEKVTMLEGRIRKRLRALEIASFAGYCSYFFSEEGQREEVSNLLDVVTTNKTSFFREPAHFEYLARTVLPQIQGQAGGGFGSPAVVWSAGCSTGEEPFTLALVMAEFAEKNRGFQWRVLATDVSQTVLQKARLAVFSEEAVKPIPINLLRKYFLRGRDPEKRRFRVAPELRQNVEFRHLNLMDSEYGSRELVDIIFCRNVLIYFDRQTQVRLIRRFIRQLRPSGYLFLGHSESLNGCDLPLEGVAPTVYRNVHA